MEGLLEFDPPGDLNMTQKNFNISHDNSHISSGGHNGSNMNDNLNNNSGNNRMEHSFTHFSANKKGHFYLLFDRSHKKRKKQTSFANPHAPSDSQLVTNLSGGNVEEGGGPSGNPMNDDSSFGNNNSRMNLSQNNMRSSSSF